MADIPVTEPGAPGEPLSPIPPEKPKKEKKELSPELKQLLCSVADHFDNEDRAVRERQIRIWRKMKLYWNGLNNIYYSEVAHDWRIWDQETSTDSDSDQAYYDKRVNVFRAYLESIIAALSQSVPPIKCYPDDADNPLDLATAKAGDKIAQLIFKHNDAPLLWLHALYTFCTEGMVACYTYTKEDDKYGTYDEKETEEEVISAYQCPTCGAPLDAHLFTEREKDEFQPGDDDALVGDAILNQGMVICPACNGTIDPNHNPTEQVVSRIVGVTKKPKSRQCMEVYGGLYVKVPNYAIKQSDIPYLRFSYETHYSNATERYGDLPALKDNKTKIGPGMDDPYEAWGRLSTQYNGEYPINTVTVNNYWFRPSAFHVLPEESAKKLKKEFPNGCKLVKINREFAEACNECLDDYWTLTYNPLSDYIHHDPLGLLLVSIQDITNDLISLTVQTIEHGIPQTFADPTVLNFDAYRQTEVQPGGIYPATPKAGKGVAEGFYEVKTSTLSPEVLPFGQNIQQLGQLVSGALPSLFGGVSEGTSKTASEYAMSRSQALQRLQTSWKMFTFWWKNIFGKAIPAYIKDMMEDEKYVQQDKDGNFVNIFIRLAELEGKIGSVELEAAEQLPLTWTQRKEAVMALIQLSNPEVMATMMSPENIPMISDILGLTDLVIPGDEDREKQFVEITKLVSSAPMPGPSPQEPMIPSVEPEPQADNHDVHIAICKHWLVGAAGREAKDTNPEGYQNVLLHLKAHLLIQQVNMMQMAQQQGEQQSIQGANPAKPNQSSVRAPIGNDNASGTVQ